MLILLTPFLLVALLLFAAGLFAFKKWKWGLGFLVAAFVFNAVFHCFALHPFPKKEGELKVMYCNIHCGGSNFDNDAITDLILSQKADIVCLGEHIRNHSSKLDSTLRANGYKFGNDYIAAGRWDGNVYYSRTPMSEVDNIRRSTDYLDETFLARISRGEDSLNVALCHLTSNNVIAGTVTPAPVDSIHSGSQFMAYLKNITAAGKLRKTQAEFLCDSIDFSKPTIILGDMNDIWGSGALRTFQKAGLNDAWWHAGFGYGATIHHPLPFRIDHILYSPHLKVRTVKRIKTRGLSDHDAVVATFEVR